MSGIDICDLSLLTDNDMQIALDKAEAMARSKPVRNIDEIVLSFTAEIRRLRAENKELRASYERVDRALNEADPATIWRPIKAKT